MISITWTSFFVLHFSISCTVSPSFGRSKLPHSIWYTFRRFITKRKTRTVYKALLYVSALKQNTYFHSDCQIDVAYTLTNMSSLCVERFAMSFYNYIIASNWLDGWKWSSRINTESYFWLRRNCCSHLLFCAVLNWNLIIAEVAVCIATESHTAQFRLNN